MPPKPPPTGMGTMRTRLIGKPALARQTSRVKNMLWVGVQTVIVSSGSHWAVRHVRLDIAVVHTRHAVAVADDMLQRASSRSTSPEVKRTSFMTFRSLGISVSTPPPLWLWAPRASLLSGAASARTSGAASASASSGSST